jgi:putative transposase
VKLDEGKIRYVIRAKEGRGDKSENVALHIQCSKRRVDQVYANYGESGAVPNLRRVGRKSVEITPRECSVILDAYSSRYRVNAVYLKDVTPAL